MRHFGLSFEKTNGPASGVQPLARPHFAAGAHRKSNSFASPEEVSPRGLVNSRGFGRGPFIPTDAPFPRSKFTQALIDVIAVVFGALFIASVIASLPLAVFILLFVR